MGNTADSAMVQKMIIDTLHKESKSQRVITEGGGGAVQKSNQIKSLLLSHHHSTSALVSEILMSVLQTVQKNNRQFTYGQTVQKTTNNLHMDRQCKKKQQQQFTYGQTVQKKQQQFTYGQYIFTDCTEDNVQNTHTCTQYA